jgi:FkbM family methyltransferase
MNAFVNFLKNIYNKLPFKPFKRFLIFIYNIYIDLRRKIDGGRTVVKMIDGITYELCLDEVIDSSIYYEGCFEKDTTEAINKVCKEGFYVLDIGANVGCHTLRFAKIVGPKGKVIAFEPMPWARNKLKRNLELNNFSNVEVEKIGLSNTISIKKASFRNSWSLSSKKNTNNIDVEIQFTTVDLYIKQKSITKIDLIKLDIDGYEFKVLQGALKSLKLMKPIIIIELGVYTLKNVGDNIDDLVQFVSSLGYGFYNEKTMQKYLNVDLLIKSIPKNKTINVLLIDNIN